MGALLLMCGLSHSGKTFLASEISKTIGAKILSLDNINMERGIDTDKEISISEWKKTHQIALKKLDGYLRSGLSVIVDDTNPLKKLRMRFKNIADNNNVETIIVYLAAPNIILENRITDTTITNKRHLPPAKSIER